MQDTTPATTRKLGRPPLKYDQSAEIVRGVHLPRVTGLSETTIWRMIRAGSFAPIIKLGEHSIGVRRSDIDAWLAQRTKAER